MSNATRIDRIREQVDRTKPDRLPRLWRHPKGILAALILLLPGSSCTRWSGDARALLQETAAVSRAAKSWQAEGTEESALIGWGMLFKDETRFKAAYESPSRMRWEATSKATTALIFSSSGPEVLMVCDGKDHWTYNSPATSFYRAPVGTGACEPEAGDFSGLADNLILATVEGRDHIRFGGSARECDVVRAEYSVPGNDGNSPAAGEIVRTLCIDRAQKLVLRARTETSDSAGNTAVTTITFSSYERNTALPDQLFQFQVPTGYFEDAGPQEDLVVKNGVYAVCPQVAAPKLVSKIEPAYSPEALQSGVSGIVLVSLQVGADGKPGKVEVIRGLGHGLDERAVEAVRQWHFQPGTMAGAPVPVGPLRVAVSFRRPDQRA